MHDALRQILIDKRFMALLLLYNVVQEGNQFEAYLGLISHLDQLVQDTSFYPPPQLASMTGYNPICISPGHLNKIYMNN